MNDDIIINLKKKYCYIKKIIEKVMYQKYVINLLYMHSKKIFDITNYNNKLLTRVQYEF